MATITISINQELVALMDQEMKEQHYANRSEFIREVMRRHFARQRRANTVVLEPVYDGDEDAIYMQNAGKGNYVSLDDMTI